MKINNTVHYLKYPIVHTKKLLQISILPVTDKFNRFYFRLTHCFLSYTNETFAPKGLIFSCLKIFYYALPLLLTDKVHGSI